MLDSIFADAGLPGRVQSSVYTLGSSLRESPAIAALTCLLEFYPRLLAILLRMSAGSSPSPLPGDSQRKRRATLVCHRCHSKKLCLLLPILPPDADIANRSDVTFKACQRLEMLICHVQIVARRRKRAGNAALRCLLWLVIR